MTSHCATCNCADDQRPPQPSTSSPGIRRLALAAAREAVERARESRKKPTEESVTRAVKMPDLAEQLAEIAADPTAYVRRTREMTRMTAAPTGPDPRTDTAVET